MSGTGTTTTIKAYAAKPQYLDSPVTTGTYTITYPGDERTVGQDHRLWHISIHFL